jgi:hypothetical protein
MRGLKHGTISKVHLRFCSVTVVSLTQCLTSYVGSHVLSSGNIAYEAYQSDITGSTVVLMNEPFI